MLSKRGLATGGVIFLLLAVWSLRQPGKIRTQLVDNQPVDSNSTRATAAPGAAPVPSSLASSPAQPAAGNARHWRQDITEPRFARFAGWSEKYLHTPLAERAVLEAEGIELARQRREKLADLIPADPRRALELAVPYAVRQAMPENIRAEFETPVSRRGNLNVFGTLAEPGHEGDIPSVYRTVTFDENTYQAYVYGWRSDEPTRFDIPLNGITLDNLAALSDSPVRVLDADEALAVKTALAEVDPICQVSGAPTTITGTETVVDVGGEPLILCSPAHAAALSESIIAAEAAPSDSAPAGVTTAASAYTEGTKTLIIIRVDFSDLPGVPFGDSTGADLISGLNDFYRTMSFGKTGFTLVGDGSDVTPTFRMPQTAAYYGANDPSVLRNAARAAARDSGYVLSQYNFDLICFGFVPGFQFSGLGYVGAPGAWIRGSSAVGVAGHELGHNFGLNHANFWDTSGQSVIGDGTSVEYGDIYDTMGSAGAGSKHFNARYKSYLNWLTSAEVKVYSTNGVYRLFPHDDPNATGVRALRVPRSSTTNYWVEFRQHYTGNKWLADGVGIRWAFNANQSSLLLDTTPGSTDGKNDSAVMIGRTFADTGAGVYITPIRKGGTTPESIDVVINRGIFPDNKPPQVTLLAAVTNAAPNSALVFNVTATDPNGDDLAYYWDFGDGSWGTNGPAASHAWNSTGEYVLRCVVTDMKGGEASAAAVVRIGSPATYHLSGRIVTPSGVPLQGVLVSASSTRVTWTDSDGRFNLVGLVSGTYTVKAVLSGYVFSPSFQNPVSLVAASRDGVDFYAIPPDGLETAILVPEGAVWSYLDNGSDQGTAWRSATFDDSTWAQGPAPLGYGDGDEATITSYGSASNNKYITTYFRHHFQASNPSQLNGLSLGVRRDDGVVVYLNGAEVFRSNMPSGTITASTAASSSVGGTDETAFFTTTLSPALLRQGANVLAVELHQYSRTSSDTVFDLHLLATTAAAIPPPNLGITTADGTLQIYWPDTPGTWQLYSAAELNATNAWLPVSVSPTLQNGRRVITLPASETQQYFRLGTP